MRRVGMLTIAFLLGLGNLAIAQSVPPGSYQQTCKNIDYRSDVLVAYCQDSGGHWQNAQLRDVQSCRNDIINDDGALRCGHGVGYPNAAVAGLPGGTYTQSCQEVHIDGDDLVARCQNTSGNLHDAKLDDYRKCGGDIVNDNGKLRCIATPGYQAAYPPQPGYAVNVEVSGPYTQSCKDIKSHGDHLEARCQAHDGDWHKTSLDDFHGCHGQIINEDGNLRCVAAAAYVGDRYPGIAYQTGLPGGSYTQSCEHIRVHGDDLEARCVNRDGNAHDAKLDDYQKCKSEIINDDGHLRCEK
jgi:hypothetical protein